MKSRSRGENGWKNTKSKTEYKEGNDEDFLSCNQEISSLLNK